MLHFMPGRLREAGREKEENRRPRLHDEGIRAGKLEYREGAIWGNPYLRVLRRQLEQYIREKLGADRLSSGKNQTELRNIKKEIAALKRRLADLQAQRTELEKALGK